MPTVKDVVYKIVRKRNPALAEYYYHHRHESIIPNDMHVQKLFNEEYRFWRDELKLLHIPSRELNKSLILFKQQVEKGKFLDGFEQHVLPLAVAYWCFQE